MPLPVTVGSAGVLHRCRGDLEHEKQVHLRVQAVHAPEGLRVDPAGDHLRSKVDPAAGEVHDEGGLSRFFHNRRPNRAPSKAGGSKRFDYPLGASTKGRRPSLVCVARPRRSHRPVRPHEGRHTSQPDREAVDLRRRRRGPFHPAISQDGKEARVGSQIADGQSGGIENTRRPWSEVRPDLPQLRQHLREAACQQRQGDEPLPHHPLPGLREARVESMKAKGPWGRARGRPSRRGPGLRHGSEDPMAVRPHQRSTSDHLLIIW